MDIDEYVVDIANNEGLAEGLNEIDGGVTVHHACHARAQNMGIKARDMLKLIPNIKIDVVERCAGHGGTFGVMKETHDLANKVVGRFSYPVQTCRARGLRQRRQTSRQNQTLKQ